MADIDISDFQKWAYLKAVEIGKLRIRVTVDPEVGVLIEQGVRKSELSHADLLAAAKNNGKIMNHDVIRDVPMTRDEHRAKCIEEMEAAYWRSFEQSDKVSDYLIAAFDALHGIARVNPIEATEEMVDIGADSDGYRPFSAWAFKVMSAAGDLTNPPETKT